MTTPLPDPLAGPPRFPPLARHRWVLGEIKAKCDRDAAAGHRERFGGRVDRSWVVPYLDGSERLGPWQVLLPHIDPPTDPCCARSSQPANPQEGPTSLVPPRVMTVAPDRTFKIERYEP